MEFFLFFFLQSEPLFSNNTACYRDNFTLFLCALHSLCVMCLLFFPVALCAVFCLSVACYFVRIVFLHIVSYCSDRLCGLVVRVLGYRSGGPGSIPGTTRKK
jgi:hypothetical protein